MRQVAVVLSVLLCAALLWGASPAKEKPAAPAGAKYVYIDPVTPAELVTAIRDKGMRLAFLFDPAQAAWMKSIVPVLKGTQPMVFVRGNLTPEEIVQLKKTLDLFEYEVTLIHVKLTPGDSIGPVPVPSLMSIERIEDYQNKWIDFEFWRGSGKPERAVQQSKKDAEDLGTPFTVAGGMIFKQSKVCLMNIDRPGASQPKGMDTTVLFSTDVEKLKKFIGL